MEEQILAALQPFAEKLLRPIIADEVQKAIAQDRAAEKPEKMYTRGEVAEMLHISLPTLWDRERKGLIKSTRQGRRVLYSESQVKQLIGN